MTGCDFHHNWDDDSGWGGAWGGGPDAGSGWGWGGAGGGSSGCRSTTDCGAGAYCDVALGACIPSTRCQTMIDCGNQSGMICDQGTCVPAPPWCQNNTQCGMGCYCLPCCRTLPDGTFHCSCVGSTDNGSCTETGACQSDADCTIFGAGFHCDNRQTCVPPAPPPATCGQTTDRPCPAGQHCQNGTCVDDQPQNPTGMCQYNAQCGPGGRCVDGMCQRPCTTSSQCGTGDACIGGFCVPDPSPPRQCTFNTDCPGNATCINAVCHHNCQSQADCSNPADMCDHGICQPNWQRQPSCRSSAECTGGNQCVDGICRHPCWQASDCAQAGADTVCHLGYCFAPNEANPQCMFNRDCPRAGQMCVDASCQ
ncbi:MAG TPA: hypothetical protein VKN99_26525 [Polyangia bacterium]|nr:hypothetical protein [Polyangia bacterium]